ncbi:MAG: RNA-directed DNA polymerase [Sphingobacteriales bacterium]|nr:MAG: RNA-directed DNA polymerase [Sphingobacteriales bacterium]
MNYNDYKREFTEKALRSGFSYEVLQACLQYAEKLFSNDLPVIFNLTHFASLVGYKQTYIQRAIVFTHHFYRKFEISKANGSQRKISEPLPSLKEIQGWILKHILYKLKVSRFAKAYSPGISIKQNLQYHRDQPLVLSIDVKDFFTSLTRDKVEQVFKMAGYSSSLSNLFSKICTLDGRLPQGASTSPYLSNLILYKFDEEIGSFCKQQSIRYTRYADDITISGNFDPDLLRQKVQIELDKLSLVVNEKKVKVMKAGVRQVVTGVVVNKKIQVPRNKRKEIRQAIYYITKFGLQGHLSRESVNRRNYINHLLGQVSFVLFLNPLDKEFIGYKDFLVMQKQQDS